MAAPANRSPSPSVPAPHGTGAAAEASSSSSPPKVLYSTALPIASVGTRRRTAAGAGAGGSAPPPGAIAGGSHSSQTTTLATNTPPPSSGEGQPESTSSSSWLDVSYRPIRDHRDLKQLKMLHDASFPLEYESRYYEWLLSIHCCCILATVPRTPKGCPIPSYEPGSIDTCNLQRPPSSEKKKKVAGGKEEEEEEEKEESGTKKTKKKKVTPLPASLQSLVVPPQEGPDLLEEERIVGFIVGRVKHVQRKEDIPWTSLLFSAQGHLDAVGYIATFGVVPDYRGSKISQELLQRLLARFSTIGTMVTRGGWIKERTKKFKPAIHDVFLHVLGSNVAATKFYGRQGFKEVDCVPGYYQIYGKELSAVILQFPLQRGGGAEGGGSSQVGPPVFAVGVPPPAIDLTTTIAAVNMGGQRTPGVFLEDNDDLEEQLAESHNKQGHHYQSASLLGGDGLHQPPMGWSERIFHGTRFVLVLVALGVAVGFLIQSSASELSTPVSEKKGT